jgi:aerobic carbon-monoxide dehydrogenase medium subunit
VDYVAPETLADACRALDSDDAHCLAGGQSLVAMMNLGLAQPGRLVSLRRIAQLRGIETTPEGGMRIGAMTTHAELAALPSTSAGADLLAQTARVIAYPAIRARGTIGGSIALADPAADYPVALVALDAVIELASALGERTVAARAFFKGMFDTARARGEIVTAVRIPPASRRAGVAYEKLSLVAGDFAIVSVAAVVNGQACVAVGGCAMKPIRLPAFDVSDDAIAAAGQMLVSQSVPPSDHRGSSAYRMRVTPALIRRAVHAAASRAAA